MKTRLKYGIIGGLFIGVVGVVLCILWFKDSQPNQISQPPVSVQTASDSSKISKAPTSHRQDHAAQPEQSPHTGYYGDYTDARAADRSYDKTILFFHATWCSECRAFEQAIQSGAVPAGV